MSFAPGSVPQRGMAQSWAPASAPGPAPRSGRGLDLPLLALEQKPMTASPMMASTRALRTRNLFIAKLYFPRPGRGHGGLWCPCGPSPGNALHAAARGLRAGARAGGRPCWRPGPRWQRQNQQGRRSAAAGANFREPLFSLESNFMENFVFFQIGNIFVAKIFLQLTLYRMKPPEL